MKKNTKILVGVVIVIILGAIAFFVSNLGSVIDEDWNIPDCPDANTFSLRENTATIISTTQEALAFFSDLYGNTDLIEENIKFGNFTLYESHEQIEAWYVNEPYIQYIIDKGGNLYTNWGECE